MARGYVVFQILATGLRNLFLDVPRLEELVSTTLDDNMKDYVKMLAECIYHILTATSYGMQWEVLERYRGKSDVLIV